MKTCTYQMGQCRSSSSLARANLVVVQEVAIARQPGDHHMTSHDIT